jgi:hypothetical protein
MVLAFKKQPISPAVLKNQQYLQLSWCETSPLCDVT